MDFHELYELLFTQCVDLAIAPSSSPKAVSPSRLSPGRLSAGAVSPGSRVGLTVRAATELAG